MVALSRQQRASTIDKRPLLVVSFAFRSLDVGHTATSNCQELKHLSRPSFSFFIRFHNLISLQPPLLHVTPRFVIEQLFPVFLFRCLFAMDKVLENRYHCTPKCSTSGNIARKILRSLQTVSSW